MGRGASAYAIALAALCFAAAAWLAFRVLTLRHEYDTEALAVADRIAGVVGVALIGSLGVFLLSMRGSHGGALENRWAGVSAAAAVAVLLGLMALAVLLVVIGLSAADAWVVAISLAGTGLVGFGLWSLFPRAPPP